MSYLDYSMSVIVGRALPDIRDGLKPVHRRILYAHERDGPELSTGPPASAPRSSAKCSVSITRTATRRCTTRWSAWRSLSRMRYPLIDGQGNFGSVDGDPPAATGTPKRVCRGSRMRCSKTSTRRRSISARTSTTANRSRKFFPPASRTCWSTDLGHRGRHGDEHPAAQPDARS